ncbi:Calx-beta domain-containing protein, partial [Alcaligenes faecalis]
LRVRTAQDTVYEGPEDFKVEITEVINALEGTLVADSSIIDDRNNDGQDDDALATVNIAGVAEIAEGQAGTFTVTRDGGDAEQAAKVKLGLTHVDTDAADFEGTLQIKVGDSWVDVDPTAEYEVPADGGLELRVRTAQDTVYEGPEDFKVEITEVINALEGTLVADSSIIDDRNNDGQDDDALATVNIAGVAEIAEGQAGTFTVTRDGGDAEQAAKVKLGLTHVDTDAADFEGTLQIKVGDSWVDVDPTAEYEVPADGGLELRVRTAQDTVYEGPEDFKVEITEVINALEGTLVADS